MTEQNQTKPKTRARTKYEEAGVPAEWLNDRGRFRGPGLDARYKSQLVREALEHEEANRGRKGSPAHRMLEKLGWTEHLPTPTTRSASDRSCRASSGQSSTRQPLRWQCVGWDPGCG